jgi:hypothetical protein
MYAVRTKETVTTLFLTISRTKKSAISMCLVADDKTGFVATATTPRESEKRSTLLQNREAWPCRLNQTASRGTSPREQPSPLPPAPSGSSKSSRKSGALTSTTTHIPKRRTRMPKSICAYPDRPRATHQKIRTIPDAPGVAGSRIPGPRPLYPEGSIAHAVPDAYGPPPGPA